MIIVLLLFFQSICRFCQRIVLHIYDRWINPKNVRLLTETKESKVTLIKRHNRRDPTTSNIESLNNVKSRRVARQRYTNSTANTNTFTDITANDHAHLSGRNTFIDAECRFCANTPQGYCRHHLHLQELNVQRKQQQEQHGFWNPLTIRPNIAQEYRQLRKINRDLRRTLKNRLNAQHTKLQFLPKTASATSAVPITSEDSGYCSNSNNSSPITNESLSYAQETTYFFTPLSEEIENICYVP